MSAALSGEKPLSRDIEFVPSSDELLRCARLAYGEHHEQSCSLVASKRDLLQSYDVDGMTRAVAVCHWGRSGSLLLASFLDGHPDVVMLPDCTSENIYPFFLEYASLPLWEKLIVYPTYSARRTGTHGDLFLKNNPEGDFAVEPADYYAAVLAVAEVFGARSPEWLGTRARFFQLLHVAYTVAVRRHLQSPRPLMVYAQHWFDQRLADYFVQDFPQAKFIHTIRDPVSALDSWFEWSVGVELYRKNSSELPLGYVDAALNSSIDLLARGWDSSHRGMEARTRAIRFEDMHVATEVTFRRLAEWLGLSFEPCLLQSTWNGRPWVVTVRGRSWCGANPANARRKSGNLSLIDRWMLFALKHEHFVSWGYPLPRAFRRHWVRSWAIALLWLIPTKTELKNVRVVLAWQALPRLRRGWVGFALRAPFFLLKSRLRMMRFIARQSRWRHSAPVKPLELL
jgi:Sulfotransferase family